MQVFLVAQCGQFPAIVKTLYPMYEASKRSIPSMNLHLAGAESRAASFKDTVLIKKQLRPKMLESFFSVTSATEKYLGLYDDYLLDSGAFSMMMGNAGEVDFKNYVEQYIAYIKKHDVKKFFELDIDSIVGYEEVLKIRKHITDKVGRPPIPVWHKSRGMTDFKEMCRKYPYVAIGGYVSKEFSKDEIRYFPKLISYAHKQGAKIHGLGFTSLVWLPKCHFDSVDSTAWVSGNKFGYAYKFNGKTMTKIKKPQGTRVKNIETAVNNFSEWCKFSKWAETHL